MTTDGKLKMAILDGVAFVTSDLSDADRAAALYAGKRGRCLELWRRITGAETVLDFDPINLPGEAELRAGWPNLTEVEIALIGSWRTCTWTDPADAPAGENRGGPASLAECQDASTLGLSIRQEAFDREERVRREQATDSKLFGIEGCLLAPLDMAEPLTHILTATSDQEIERITRWVRGK